MITTLGIHWAGFDRIIFLPIFLVLIFFIIRNYRRITHAATLLVHTTHRVTIFPHFSPRRQWLKAFLLSSGIMFIFLALLQPQWGKKEHTIAQEGRDVLILLDISRSMKAADIKPNRLDFAKLKIKALLDKIVCDRVGLIVFSGSAFVQCPLTADHAAFSMFLDHVDTEIVSSGTTALDTALLKALEVFSSSQGRKNKLAVLLTDGEDFSCNINAATNQALQENLHVFAIGIGTTDGAPIPVFNEEGIQTGHQTNEKGEIVLSCLGEQTLSTLCSHVHGIYVPMTYNDNDIDTIASRVAQYEKEKFEDKKISMFEDQYPWLLGIAWICLLLEWIV
jgi:Ca-activated chloride channel family protein